MRDNKLLLATAPNDSQNGGAKSVASGAGPH